ncbi:DUF1054 family protein [Levilactobacillus zymae]|uniref:DUF1054 family protein n=1 Tax=Levilactobacillus zymae TaxID=267363 RepID=UPI0028BA6B19|nr:DUF1054 family protein [Levilactobacillus zymae]MDT6980990.1 DUF1054 family protein [Levilactobacillus zymae]
MYQDSDFAVFDDGTLPGRLAKIRAIIDPKFTATVAALQPQLAQVGVPVYPHLALHRRRTKNPPPDTWVALSTSKRGYKMLPHFEFGLWDDQLYIWLVVLQEAKDRQTVIGRVNPQTVAALPTNFEWANDHTDKTVHQPLTAAGWDQLMAVQSQKHAEWLIGRTFAPESAFFTGDAATQLATIQTTIAALVPVYRELIGLTEP